MRVREVGQGLAVLFTDVTDLLPRLRQHLLDLLRDLSAEEWGVPTACPGWSVHDVATHLLGVDVANLALRRDGWVPHLVAAADADAWLNDYNEQWVMAARRLSPALLIELLASVGPAFDRFVTGLDLHATGQPVGWATGPEPAPVWLDVAREYMERFVHQQQIRDATGRKALPPELLAPVLATAAHALPVALRPHRRPDGTVVRFVATGEGGGAWDVVAHDGAWSLSSPSPSVTPTCSARAAALDALRLLARDPAAPRLTVVGDPELGEALQRSKAVLG
jgi:uncharacterized protein (TIGR03083 family)